MSGREVDEGSRERRGGREERVRKEMRRYGGRREGDKEQEKRERGEGIRESERSMY